VCVLIVSEGQLTGSEQWIKQLTQLTYFGLCLWHTAINTLAPLHQTHTPEPDRASLLTQTPTTESRILYTTAQADVPNSARATALSRNNHP
jgi:hypothetical protein